MSARILVVDDQELNRKVLKAKLSAEYYAVQLAGSGAEALVKAQTEPPDIVLLDVMMPDMDGYLVCAQLKRDPKTAHIPVLMVTALDGRDARVRALESGADDYLTKPVDDAQLFARLRNLLRLKPMMDELRARGRSGERAGVIQNDRRASDRGDGARILVIDEETRQVAEIETVLGQEHQVARFNGEEKPGAPRPDLFVVSLCGPMIDGLKVIAHIRSEESTRRLAVLAIADEAEKGHALRALDIGADDVVFRPLDHEELAARARTLIKRKRYVESMSAALDAGLEAAATDPLTGLANRRALEAKLAPLLRRAANGNGVLSALMIDIDHFKAVNDQHGHAIGDALLREFASRLAATVRPADLACRLGGEEFAVIMPGTAGDLAALAAERLRKRIAGSPFLVTAALSLAVTASLGVTEARSGDTAETLLMRADAALYRAKAEGRNRVLSEARA
jgi:two-component system cell cycle response regulator